MSKTLYTVAEVASIVGVSEGLIYQGFKSGAIHAATDEEMRANGINPDAIRKPLRWITAQELERYRSQPRKSSFDYVKKEIPK